MLPQNPNGEPCFYQLRTQSKRKLASIKYAVITEKICNIWNSWKISLLQYCHKILLTADFCGYIKSTGSTHKIYSEVCSCQEVGSHLNHQKSHDIIVVLWKRGLGHQTSFCRKDSFRCLSSNVLNSVFHVPLNGKYCALRHNLVCIEPLNKPNFVMHLSHFLTSFKLSSLFCNAIGWCF